MEQLVMLHLIGAGLLSLILVTHALEQISARRRGQLIFATSYLRLFGSLLVVIVIFFADFIPPVVYTPFAGMAVVLNLGLGLLGIRKLLHNRS